MLDDVLVTGDYVIFDTLLQGGLITGPLLPATMKGSSKAKISNKEVCVEGDEHESSVEVKFCPYIAGSYSIPGMGTFRIKEIKDNHKSKTTKIGSKIVLLKGGKFNAEFTVDTPAQQPNPPGPNLLDTPQKRYTGTGKFMPRGKKYKTK